MGHYNNTCTCIWEDVCVCVCVQKKLDGNYKQITGLRDYIS